jgi:hypothetical protein
MATKDVPQNLYSAGGEEPTNNPPTSARHPSGMMTCAELPGDRQKHRIKSPCDNNPGSPSRGHTAPITEVSCQTISPH